jgi:hypothetical protein
VSLAALALASLLLSADAPATGAAPASGATAATAPGAATAPAPVTGAEPTPTGGTPAKKPSARKSNIGAAKTAKKDPAASKPATKADEQGAAPPSPEPAPSPAVAIAEPAYDEGRLLTEHKCSKCHDLSLAFSSALSDAHWRLHMKRMANRPGAAITEDQAHRIHEYLKASVGRR